FTTGFDYLIYDPALNLFYGLGGSFDLLTGASAFLNAMTQQLIAAEPALFGIEIRPDADFYALSGAFTENAASAFENGLGARSLIPLPNALALCLLGLALMRAAPARRVAGR
ncbi:MAG: hypothetical protein JNJ60_08690, partial [Rhodocyclaceae bacterium]|nr:hypothetical protein [Rhodocyclaceae bacterium]